MTYGQNNNIIASHSISSCDEQLKKGRCHSFGSCFRLYVCPFFSFSVFEVSIVFQGCLKDISSRKFQGGFTEGFKFVYRKFQGCFQAFKGCFKEVSRVFQESFKGVSAKIEGCFKGI